MGYIALITIILLALVIALKPERIADERLQRGKGGSNRNGSSFGSVCAGAVWVGSKVRSSRKVRR